MGPTLLLSGDGKTLAIGGDGGEWNILDVATGKSISKFKTPSEGDRFGDFESRRYVLSHDGRQLVTSGAGRRRGAEKITVWETTSGKSIREQPTKIKDATFVTATLSADGKTLVAVEGKEDRKGDGEVKPQLRFWDMATGQETRSVQCPLQYLSELHLLGDGKMLLALDRGSQGVHLLDATTGKEERTFHGGRNGMRGIAISPDQNTLFIAESSRVVAHDVQSGKQLHEFPTAASLSDEPFGNRFGDSAQFTMAVSPDGKALAVPAQASVAFWDVKSGKEIDVVDGHRDQIDSIAFHPDGAQVLTGAADSRLLLWGAGSGQQLREFQQASAPKKDDDINRMRGGGLMMNLFQVRGSFTPDGASVGGLWWGRKLHVFEAATGKLRRHLGVNNGLTAFAFAPDNRSAAVTGTEGQIRLYDLASGRHTRNLGEAPKSEPNDDKMMFAPDLEQGVFSLAYSRDGRMLASAGMHLRANGLGVETHYWELASGKERMQFQADMDMSERNMFSFSAVMSALECFNAAIAFSPDNKTVAEAGFSTIRLKDARTGREVRVFGGKQIVAPTVHFSPDGKMVLAGKHDGAIRLWDLATGTMLFDFPAHRGAVTALAFSPDGKRLASGSKDTSVLVWNWDYIRREATRAFASREPASTGAPLDSLWNDLAGNDAVKAYDAIQSMARSPAQVVALVKGRVRAVPPVDPRELEKLVDELDNPKYAARLEAERSLEKLGDIAAAAIKKRLAGTPTLEMGRRLETLSKKLDAQVVATETLQALRAIEALELIGTPEARAVLEGLAKGAAGHRLTEEARQSLMRMGGAGAKVR